MSKFTNVSPITTKKFFHHIIDQNRHTIPKIEHQTYHYKKSQLKDLISQLENHVEYLKIKKGSKNFITYKPPKKTTVIKPIVLIPEKKESKTNQLLRHQLRKLRALHTILKDHPQYDQQKVKEMEEQIIQIQTKLNGL